MPSRRYTEADARKDIASKSLITLDRESAHKWTLLAVEAYRKFNASGELKWFGEAEVLRHEALEHASGAEDGGKLLREVEAQIDRYRPREAQER